MISSIPVLKAELHVTAIYMESGTQYCRLWYHIPKIELSRGVLTNLLKPTQRLFLRPEIASFLVKISSTSKTCNMSDRSELDPDYSYNRSPSLNHFNILFMEDEIFKWTNCKSVTDIWIVSDLVWTKFFGCKIEFQFLGLKPCFLGIDQKPSSVI